MISHWLVDDKESSTYNRGSREKAIKRWTLDPQLAISVSHSSNDNIFREYDCFNGAVRRSVTMQEEPTVFIVDDEPMIRESLEFLIRNFFSSKTYLKDHERP